MFGILNLVYWDLPFDLAQGGELVENPELVEVVEPFEIWFLMLVIFMNISKQVTFVFSAKNLHT